MRIGVSAIIVVVLVVMGATVAMAALRAGGGEPVGTAVEEEPVTPGPDQQVIYVHVGGAVRAPGIYRLDAGARVVDAIAAALGFAEEADRDRVNLARPVGDGEQLIILTMGEATDEEVAGESPSAGRQPGGLVSLNTATLPELQTLPRIGPALAARILDWREQHGGFASVDDLLAVSGIGEKMLETLRPLVSL